MISAEQTVNGFIRKGSGKAERKRHKVTSFEKLNKVTALLLPGQDSSHKILQAKSLCKRFDAGIGSVDASGPGFF